MAVSCVRTESQEFKDKAKALNITEGQLENILHEYYNSEELQNSFTEDEFIESKLNGIPLDTSSEIMHQAWENAYSQPLVFDNVDDYKRALESARNIFGRDAVGVTESPDGKYTIRVAEPFDYRAYQQEINAIKEEAIANGTFMKAPNGNPSNLNEQQWLQVRTKTFKDWFGDWENDAENASKVVDENGEPLVVHHGSSKQFREFSYQFVREPESGFFFSSDKKYSEQFGPVEYAVFLSVKSPIDAGNIRLNHESVEDILIHYDRNVERTDGIIGNDSLDERLTPSEGWEIMVYHPNQIKSATQNRGSFNPENTDIAMFTLGKSSEKTVTKGKLGVNKEQLITLLGSTMYQSGRQEVAVKELMQNAFDAVKIAKSQGLISRGKIDVDIDTNNRTVRVSDNGTGMTPEIVQKAFFTIGGSYKGEGVDNRLKSGGLGLAKMAFLFGSDYVDVTTVKDGVKTHVRATPKEIQNDNFDIVTSKTKEPNGTSVEVKIPEVYYDQNGEERDIWFSRTPDFLAKPMMGDVDVNVTTNDIWSQTGKNTSTYDKSIVPEGYTSIGKASTAFGDIEIYITPEDNGYSGISSEVLISGLHQFTKNTWLEHGNKARYKAIINILPSVGVADQLYPMNNQREGFRSTINAEVEDLEFLLKRINSILEKKSINQAFGRTISMDSAQVADVKRITPKTKEEIFSEVRNEIVKEFGTTSTKPDQSNALDWRTIRTKKVESEKSRTSSFDASGIKINEETVGSVDTSNLDLSKPVFHNNTTMEIGEDGQQVITKLGELMLELKSLFTQTYKDAGIKAYNGSNITDYIAKQYWGISFDRDYGGVNVHPNVMNLLAINPFYKITQYEGVDTALVLTEYITHLIKHEFNHNYARSEDAAFTGRFPQTDAEFAGIGAQFNKEWKNKLYLLIKDNLQTFVKYAEKYRQAANIGESFKGNSLREGTEGQESSPTYDGRNIQGNTNGENVQGHGGEFDSLTDTLNKESQQTINIWAGTDENADLSNMAIRPFTYNGIQFNSVEQAFQYMKGDYAGYEGFVPAEGTDWASDTRAIIMNSSPFGAKRVGRRYSMDKAHRDAWDAASSGIMKDLIKESFRQNPQALQRLLSTGDAVFTHLQESENSKWREEFPRILMEIRSELREEQGVSSTQTQSQTETPLIVTGQNIRRENQRFLKNQWGFTDGFYALYDNGVGLTQSEVTAEARQLSYWLSDKITELQQNPEKIYNEFGIEKKNGWATEKDKNDDIDAISRMSRRDLVSKIGIVNLKNLYQKEVLDGNALDNLKGRDRKKVNLLSNNVSTLFELGLATFSNNEGYKIVHNSELDTYENADYYGNESIAEDGIIDIAELAEQGTNLEDWMVDKSTIEVLGTASAIVRSALSQCYILDEKGEIKKDYLGRPERVSQNDAVKSIVRWTQGSQSIRDMISKLSAKSNSNPWIAQILKRLQDESGLEADFISQFYTTFQKHFQLFDIVKRNNDKKYYFMDVNNRPALNNAVNEVIAAFSINEAPLFTTVGFNQTELDKFRATVVRLSNNLNVTEESFNKYKEGYVDRFVKLSEMLGYSISKENVATSLNYNNFRDAIIALSNMLDRFEAERNNTGTYRPFEYSRDARANSVLGYLRDFLRVITESVEDTTESSFYESGKMRQSYQIPSYATKLFGQLTGDAELFNTTLDTEFAPYEWFMTQTARGKRRWRNYMLATLEGMDEKTRKQVLSHKRNLNFMGDQYMRGMSPERYALLVLTEFGRSRNVNGMQISYYRFPIQSNKASSDFLSFIRFTGVAAKTTMLDHFMKVFSQELSRIQTVIKRDRKKGDVDYIANFDGERGRKFCFLDYMNNPESIVSDIFSKEDAARLKELIQEKIEGKESAENNVGELESLARNAIESFLNLETRRAIQSYSELGVMDAIRNIDGVIDENINVPYRQQAEEFIENFVWNDTLAAIGMTQLLVTDLAFYENSDDFQKRFAQVHSPGTRGNRFATDYNGVRVSDGNIRNVFLNDFETYKTNMMENLSIILDRNIAQAPEDSRAAYTALKENILDRMSKINVTDGQALTSPASMRKKGFMFGQWSRDAERAYDRIKSGEYTMRDLEIAFNVKKPFTYSQLSQNVASEGTPLSKIKVPTQVKDSEYMLVMAGALLNSTETEKPNLLKVLYEVMEDSAFDGDDTTGRTQNGRGIDAFVFNSAVKSGLTGSSNIVNDWYNGKFEGTNAEVEAKLKKSLLGELYAKKQDGSIDFSKYNEFTVKSIPVEDYALQTEVPLHMIDEKVIWGSQMRAILESNLAYVDYEGNPVEFSWTDSKGEQHTANREKFKEAYENKAAEIVNLCADELYDELGLGGDLVNSRIAVAKKLQEEIKNNYERYGLDLLLSCSIDKNGKFRLPLGDPTISKRVEQLVNSVVKNRLNKPKVAGGMAVQVSNIGTSRQLNFRFFDKQGNLLPTREEWLKVNPSRTNEDYLEFCRENQGGFAYEENYAPAHMRDMFNLFTDEKGNVDIESIEMLDDNLLFSIDQRTPTEFYYSISVSKTIDFLPQEAGDGYMRPYEITEKDDSDFDVDKDNKWKLKASIRRKKGVHIKPMDLINLVPELKAMKLGDAVRAATKFLYSKDKLKNSNTLDEKEWKNPELFRAMKRAWIKESYEVVYPTEGINAMLNDMWRMSKAVLQHESNAAKILSPGGNAELTRVGYIREVMNKTGRTYDDVSTLSDKELKSIVKAKDLNTMSFLNQLEYYQRNNDASSNLGIFAVAATSHNLLEGQGYGLANETEFTIAGKTYGNVVEFDVTYDDDGMLVSKSLGANVSGAADAAKVPSHGYLNINNSTINEYLVLLRTGMPMEKAALFISSTPLKELVSKFNAANVERFTKKFDKIISEEIDSLKPKVNLSDDSTRVLDWEEIKRAQEENVSDLIKLKVLLSFQRLSALTEGMRMLTAATRYNSIASAVGPEIIDNVLFENQIEGYRLNPDNPIAYKKVSFYVDREGNRLTYGDKVRDDAGNRIAFTPDNIERLRNSLLIEAVNEDKPVGFDEILEDHPMLKAFSQGYTIAGDVFEKVLGMPLAKDGFKSIIASARYASAFKNRDLLNKFSNFYLSYLLVAFGVINSGDTMHYVREFPEEFLKKRNNYKGNKLVDSVKPKVTDGVISLELSTTGMKVDDRSDLQSAWADLYKKDKEFALDLFRYNFFKGGLGFSPKTFMNLLPIQVRENIDGYAKVFSDTPNVSSENVIDQFFRNNAYDNSVVRNYKLEDLQSFGAEYNEKTRSLTFRGDGYERMKSSPFFKFKDANNVTFIYKIATSDSDKKISVFYITTPLGNNGEFLEMSSGSITQSAVRSDVIDGNTDNATTDSVPDSVVDASERMSAPKTDEQIRKEAEEYASAFKEAGGEWLSDNYEKLVTFATDVKKGNRQIIPEVQRTKLKTFFERMGISYTEDKINDIVKKLCS